MNLSIDYIKQTIRLADLVPGLQRHGRYWVGPCPLCGEGVDRFNVKESPDGELWLCRICGDGKYHDVIDFLQRRDGLTFAQVLERYSDGAAPAGGPLAVRPPSRPPTLDTPPDDGWQIAALEAAAECADYLHGETATAKAALAWLTGTRKRTAEYHGDRCLLPETVRAAGLGYNPHKRTLPNGRTLPRGITVPCMVNGSLWYVKVRRTPGEVKRIEAAGGKASKYPQIDGSGKALYNADKLIGSRAVFVVEGEFDALVLGQYTDAAVVTMGGAGNLPAVTWARYFAAVSDLLLCLDDDDAGRAALARWQTKFPRACLAPLPWNQPGQPARGEDDKDVTDFRRAGGNVVAWAAAVLREAQS